MRILACSALFLCANVALADDTDRWWGTDKAAHAAASFGIAGATYSVSACHFSSRVAPLLIGSVVTASAGIGKEIWDSATGGQPSWKDLTWDALGLATGLVVSYLVDLAFRGSTLPRHEALQRVQPSLIK